jgi:beta-glucosidase/6-phospho-beta-glucosidase/beta-galactosidase
MFRSLVVLAASFSLSIVLWGCGSNGTGGDSSKCDEDCIVATFKGDSNFLWGAATAAAQIEGAWNVSGKQPSIWDDFCHGKPTRDTTDKPFKKVCGKVPQGQSGSRWTTLEVTDDFYNHYKEDIQTLHGYGMNAMRVSISWPRVMPLDKATNKHKKSTDGVEFYRKVFAEMASRSITPVVSLYHWDLPNDLSWLDETVVGAFEDYANLMFNEFPEIKQWVTFNEPSSICPPGYATGIFAPGHKSTTDHLKCSHNLLRAHARTVKSFRDKQIKGEIGIILNYDWAYPKSKSDDDKKAAEYDRDSIVGIWAHPIFIDGDFPQSLKDFFGSDIMPLLSSEEKTLLKGSADFYGLNSYGGTIAEWNDKTLDQFKPGDEIAGRYATSPCQPGEDRSALKDPKFECGADSAWLWAKPEAMRSYLEYVSTTYRPSKIYVTEFGVDVKGESDMKIEDALKDEYRIEYYSRYMEQIALAKKESDVPVKGVFAWSLMDNFEWADGLNFRFGITYVNFDNLTRTPKDSARWWTNLLARMKSTTTELWTV